MKKIITSIITLSFFIVILVGCDEKKDGFPYNFPDGAGLETKGGMITALDENVTFNLTAEDLNCTKVKVVGISDAIKGVNMGEINMENGKGTINFDADKLKISKVGDKSVIRFITNISNEASYDRLINVESSFSKLKIPKMVHKDTMYHFVWEVKPYKATVKNVSIDKKIGKKSTYINLSKDAKSIDSIGFNPKDYNLLDTIYLRVIAYANTEKSDTIEKELVMDSFSGDLKKEEFTLKQKNEESAYSFLDGDYVEGTDENASIKFVSDNEGDLKIGFQVLNNIELVESTKELYETGDLLTIQSTKFDNLVLANNNLKGGEVYVFRISQTDGDYKYGIMKIIEVDKPQGVLEDSYFAVEFKM